MKHSIRARRCASGKIDRAALKDRTNIEKKSFSAPRLVCSIVVREPWQGIGRKKSLARESIDGTVAFGTKFAGVCRQAESWREREDSKRRSANERTARTDSKARLNGCSK